MRKYYEPEIIIVSFSFNDRVSFGAGDGNDPDDPGSSGWDYSDNGNAIWLTPEW